MSDTSLIILPENPSYVPAASERINAVALLKTLTPGADAIEEELSDEIRFVDCGSNFEAVSCPVCGSGLELEWWQNEMDRDYQEGFALNPIELPCCKVATPLNELVYKWPQGFARYSIEARNPQVTDLGALELLRLETALGCKVLKIIRRL
jgi:hypothetical protein